MNFLLLLHSPTPQNHLLAIVLQFTCHCPCLGKFSFPLSSLATQFFYWLFGKRFFLDESRASTFGYWFPPCLRAHLCTHPQCRYFGRTHLNPLSLNFCARITKKIAKLFIPGMWLRPKQSAVPRWFHLDSEPPSFKSLWPYTLASIEFCRSGSIFMTNSWAKYREAWGNSRRFSNNSWCATPLCCKCTIATLASVVLPCWIFYSFVTVWHHHAAPVLSRLFVSQRPGRLKNV